VGYGVTKLSSDAIDNQSNRKNWSDWSFADSYRLVHNRAMKQVLHFRMSLSQRRQHARKWR
jgi:hypothetical protein